MINAQLHSLVVSKDMALAKSFRAVLDKRDKLVKILTEKKSGLDVEFRCDDETMPADGDAGKLVLLPHLTPLQQAVVQRNYEAVDVLLEYGQSDPSALLPCDVLLRRNNNDDEDSGSEKVAFNGLPEGTSTIMLALRNLLDMEINAKVGKQHLKKTRGFNSFLSSPHHCPRPSHPPHQASDGRLPYNWGPACDICRRLLACKDVDVHAGWSRWGRDESAFTVARELLMAPAFLMACGDEAAAVREIAALVLRHPSNGGDAANILRRKSVDY